MRRLRLRVPPPHTPAAPSEKRSVNENRQRKPETGRHREGEGPGGLVTFTFSQPAPVLSRPEPLHFPNTSDTSRQRNTGIPASGPINLAP